MSISMKRFFLTMLILSILLSGCASTAETAETVVPAETTAETAETVVPTETPAETTALAESKKAEPQNLFGRECYYIDGAVYAAELGAPILGKDLVAELYAADDLNAAAEQITNIGDAFYYLLEAGAFQQPTDACSMLTFLIVGDYDSVGLIAFHFTDNYYCLVYVEQDGVFYALNPFRPYADWIYKQENNCFSNSDVNVLSEMLYAAFPFKGTELTSIYISGDLSKPHGAKVFSHAGTTIPEGLGQPLLSDEQIDALIAEQDYVKTAATINTLADAVNYYSRSGMTFDDKRNNNMHGNFSYKQSAWQVLKSNQGQCVTMSNLNYYFLQDNYDEVGYVHVRSPGDGHIMTYILQDGIYYLINSVDYTLEKYMSWLDSYPSILGCAENFQDIADSLTAHMLLGDGKNVNVVHLVKAPGDFVHGGQANKILYPKGCEVTEYYGNGFAFAKAKLDWQSQTRIDE